MATTLVGSGTLGNVPNATGQSNQGHLVFGVNSDRWFLFVIIAGDTTHLECYVSSSNDLATCTWSAIGTGSQSPVLNSADTWIANEGRNFAVGYANIGSTDVVYAVTGNSQTGAIHGIQVIRATVTSSTATWGTWITPTGGANTTINTPDGAAIAVSNTQRAWLLDPRLDSGDAVASIATNVDAGTSWTAAWGARVNLDISMANTVNSGALAPLASGLMLAVMDSGAVTATTTNHIFQKSTSSSAWPATATLSTIGSAMGTAQNKNDWGMVGVTTTDVHVVRRTGATAFEHRRYNGTSWAAGNTIPSTGLTGHLAGSGVFLATDGTSAWLFVIDTDTNKNIKYVKWTAGAWDSSWSTLSTSDTNVKNFISGYQQVANSQIGVVWTENTSTPFAVVGSFLGVSGGSPQTVTPVGIASEERVGAESVGFALAPTGIATGEVAGTAAVSLGVLPVGIPTSERPGVQTVAPGAVSIAPVGIPTSEVLGAAAASIGAVTISPAGITSTELLGSASATPGVATVAPAGISPTEAVGTLAVAQTIAPAGIGTSERAGTAALSLAVAPAGIPTSEVEGTATVAPGAVNVTATGIATSEQLGAVQVSTIAVQTIAPTGIPSSERFGAEAVAPGAVTLAVVGIPSGEQFGAPIIGLFLTPRGIDTAEQHGATAVTAGGLGIGPAGLPSNEQFGTATISAGAVTIAPAGIPPAEAVGTLAVGLRIVPAGIPSAERFGAVAFASGAAQLVLVGIPSEERVGTIGIGALVLRRTLTGAPLVRHSLTGAPLVRHTLTGEPV